MAIFVAFLRGMNIAGRRITNEELREAFARIGRPDADTFRASGNVIFEAPAKGNRARLARRIEAGLGEELGYEVPVFLRSGREVAAIAAFEPFEPSLVASSRGKLQVALLPGRPSRAATRRALAEATDEDRLEIRASELYWLPSGSMRDSGLDLRSVEAALGPWTMRTKGTIEQIAARNR
jgi:uncharacterized protein (DUF1697 family)